MLNNNIGLVILAAGLSVRMGRPKLLLPLGNKPILAHIVETASNLEWGDRIAVIGSPRCELEEVCRDYKMPYVYNPAPEQGQSSSVKLGLEALKFGLEGVIFLPADQPLINGELLKALVSEFQRERDHKAIVVPHFEGQSYSPVLFGSVWFPSLSKVTGDQGGRNIIKDNPGHVRALNWDDELPFIDIDTQEDYVKILRLIKRPI